ncbi:hypothetical protein VPH35_058005 [Triticum aestivum]
MYGPNKLERPECPISTITRNPSPSPLPMAQDALQEERLMRRPWSSCLVQGHALAAPYVERVDSTLGI